MKLWLFLIVLMGQFVLITSCGGDDDSGEGDADADSDSDSDSDSDVDTDTFETIALDSLAILLMVDNSISMGEEQDILADAAGPLVSSLTSTNGVDDIRVAAVTSDMGLSWGGMPYEDGDGWPGTNPCSAVGDNGAFQSCSSPSFTYAETSPSSPNPDLDEHVACLANQGTTGCGLEQQLQSAAVALGKSGQEDFVREGDLLLILLVTDEMDCSIEDGPTLFNSDEIQGTDDGPSKLNVACQENADTLYTVAHYAMEFWAAQQFAPNAVIFAAIAGVPPVSACQGRGDEIGNCLDHDDMQWEQVIQQNSTGQDAYYMKEACTRDEGSVMVTKALPGRRYVSLAVNYFGANSYIYSICNADWTPAMNDIAKMVGDAISEY